MQPPTTHLSGYCLSVSATVYDRRRLKMKLRLTRLDRIYTDQLFYFLTFCSHGRKPVLAQVQVQKAFQEFSTEAASHGVFVGRYVIMPNHFHFFAAFDDRTNLSSWMKSLKNYLSKALRTIGIPAPHWQKGYFDHLMRREDSYGSKWDYVFQNPVRHNLVADPAEWPFQGEINALSFL
jgi:putative transposase